MKKSALLSTNTICHPELISGSHLTKDKKCFVSTGFTLIELLVVIVIVGILATVSVAQFNGYQERARLARAQVAAQQSQTKILAETAVAAKEPHLILSFETGINEIINESTAESFPFTPAINADFTNETPYNSGRALDATGSRLFIIPIQNTSNLEDFTLSLWINVDSFTGSYEAIAYKENIFSLALNGTDTIRLAGNTNYTDVQGIQTGVWHHYMASIKGNTLRIWLDGELQSEQIRSTPVFQTGSNFYLRGVMFDQVLLAPVGIESF